MALNDILHLPSLATWASLTPTVSWTYTWYTTLTSGFNYDIAITGVTLQYPTTQAGNDTSQECVLEISKTGSNTVVAEVPFNFQRDSQAEHCHVPIHFFPEPVEVAANSSIQIRLAANLLNLAYNGIKIYYRQITEPTARRRIFLIT